MKVIYVDPIHARVEPAAEIATVKKVFEYPFTRWKRGAYHKEQVEKSAYLYGHPHRGWFPAGLVPNVKDFCKLNGIEAEIEDYYISIQPENPPTLQGINFREDQQRLMRAVNWRGRGLIKSPTGSGKTVLAGGIISQYPKSKIGFVVHTQILFSQTLEEFEKWFGPENVGGIGEGIWNPKRINVIMIQTAGSIFRGVAKEYREDFFALLADLDLIIIDEAHHCGNPKGYYVGLLERSGAEIRVGFTATDKKKSKKEELTIIGALGPVIGELTFEEAVQKGIIVMPRLKLISVPKSTQISKFKRYADLYREGIILNRMRNRLIVKEANKQILQGKSVLIMITDVVNKHGETLRDLLWDIHEQKAEVVHGGTKRDLREDIKKALGRKDVLCVIVTSAWREGVNIPSLDCVMNAIGIKEETTTIQVMGRGTRPFAGKEELLIIDFLDPYLFLAEHSLERLRVYNEMGILNREK